MRRVVVTEEQRYGPRWLRDGVRSAKCRHQSPEWTIVNHVNCFIRGEVIGFHVLLDSLHIHVVRGQERCRGCEVRGQFCKRSEWKKIDAHFLRIPVGICTVLACDSIFAIARPSVLPVCHTGGSLKTVETNNQERERERDKRPSMTTGNALPCIGWKVMMSF